MNDDGIELMCRVCDFQAESWRFPPGVRCPRCGQTDIVVVEIWRRFGEPGPAADQWQPEPRRT